MLKGLIMKKIIAATLVMVTITTSTFANECRDAHVDQAIKKATSEWDFYGPKVVGGSWLALGIGFTPTLAVSFPVIIGGVIAAGSVVMGKSIIDTVQVPRYTLVSHMLFMAEGKPSLDIYNSEVFKTSLKKAQNVDASVTSEKLVQLFVDGINSQRFCKNNGRPFSFKKMEKTILSDLKTTSKANI